MMPFLTIVQVVGTVVGHIAKNRQQPKSVHKPETPEALFTPPCLKTKKKRKSRQKN